jgi:hypothetical protein
MFDKLSRNFFDVIDSTDWPASTLGHALALHTRENFHDDGGALSSMADELKQTLIEGLYQEIDEICHAENTFLACRERLTHYVSEWAELQVLCLTEEEKPRVHYGDSPYISGELHHRLFDLIEHSTFIGETNLGSSFERKKEIILALDTRSAISLYYANGLNLIRVQSGDSIEGKDWYKPLCTSMLISSEDDYRKTIELPSLLPESLDGPIHGLFSEFVANGHVNPYYEWEMSREHAAESKEYRYYLESAQHVRILQPGSTHG